MYRAVILCAECPSSRPISASVRPALARFVAKLRRKAMGRDALKLWRCFDRLLKNFVRGLSADVSFALTVLVGRE